MRKIILTITSLHIYVMYAVVSYLTNNKNQLDGMRELQKHSWPFGLGDVVHNIYTSIWRGRCRDDRVIWVIYGEDPAEIRRRAQEDDDAKNGSWTPRRRMTGKCTRIYRGSRTPTPYTQRRRNKKAKRV